MMHLGAFVHETGQHVAAWRHPGAHLSFGRELRRYGGGGPARRARQDRLPVPGRQRRRRSPGQSRSARPHGQGRQVRADDHPVGAGGRDQEPRLRRDLDHDLQRALHARPPVRLARPDQRRPLGLEPRDLEQRGGCAELQPRRAHDARRPLRARHRVRRGGDGPVGQLGRGRLHPRQGSGVFFDPAKHACAEPQGQALPGAGPAQRGVLAAGPAGGGPGRRLGHRPRCRRAARRGRVHRADHLRAGQGVLRRRAGAPAAVRPHAGRGHGDAGLLSGGRADSDARRRRSTTTCSR